MSVLGRGGLATVLRVCDQYAVKIVADLGAAENEIEVLEVLGASATVVGFYGRLADQTALLQRTALLLELCQGSLNDVLLKLPSQRLADSAGLRAQQDVVMMLNCLAQLHCRAIIHQDIKPSNFLLGQDGAIKLCDFNLSRLATDSARINGGTILYFSPHMFNNIDEGYASDWWALGVTLYQMLHGLHTWPFSCRSLLELTTMPAEEQLTLVRNAVFKGHVRFRPLSGIPRAARTLIRGLLHPQPEKRWSLMQVLAGDYPGDRAFSAVALRYPQLGPDMQRLLALRRLCRLAPLHRQQPAAAMLWNASGNHDSGDEDNARRTPSSACHSLRAISSCLLQRIFSRKSSSSAARELHDVSSGGDQQLAWSQSRSGPAPTVDPMAAIAAVSYSPMPANLAVKTPAASPALNARYASTTDPACDLMRHRSAASSACAKVAAVSRALLPRSDVAARAAAMHAAAVAPIVMLTADGRLAQPRFLPCEVRTHKVDLEALQKVLSPLNPRGGGCSEEGGSPSASRPEANGGGQIQGVEVLEEMRVMLERRRMTAVGSTSGSAGGIRHQTQAYPVRSGAAGDTALRPVLPIPPGQPAVHALAGAAAAVGPAVVVDPPAQRNGCASSTCSSDSGRVSTSSVSVGETAHRGRGLLAAFEAAAGTDYSKASASPPTARLDSAEMQTTATRGAASATIPRLLDVRPEARDAAPRSGSLLSKAGGCGGGMSSLVVPRRSPKRADLLVYTADKVDDTMAIVQVSPEASGGLFQRRHTSPTANDGRTRACCAPVSSGWDRTGAPRPLGDSISAARKTTCTSSSSDRGCRSRDDVGSLFSLPISTALGDSETPEVPGAEAVLSRSLGKMESQGSPRDLASSGRSELRDVGKAAAAGLPSSMAARRCELAAEEEDERPTWGSGRGEGRNRGVVFGVSNGWQGGHDEKELRRKEVQLPAGELVAAYHARGSSAARPGYPAGAGAADWGPAAGRVCSGRGSWGAHRAPGAEITGHTGLGLPSPRVWAVRTGQLLRKVRLPSPAEVAS